MIQYTHNGQWIWEAIRELLSDMPEIIKALHEENSPAQVTRQVEYCYQGDRCLQVDKQQGKREKYCRRAKTCHCPYLSAVSAEIKNSVCSCILGIPYILYIKYYYKIRKKALFAASLIQRHCYTIPKRIKCIL